ncbi:MAG: hypothetical protein ACPLTR_07875, partial [Thermacetogeniaceae bacterium]
VTKMAPMLRTNKGIRKLWASWYRFIGSIPPGSSGVGCGIAAACCKNYNIADSDIQTIIGALRMFSWESLLWDLSAIFWGY